MPSESGRNEDNFSLEGTNHSVQILVGNLALDLRLSPIFDPSADQEPLPRLRAELYRTARILDSGPCFFGFPLFAFGARV